MRGNFNNTVYCKRKSKSNRTVNIISTITRNINGTIKITITINNKIQIMNTCASNNNTQIKSTIMTDSNRTMISGMIATRRVNCNSVSKDNGKRKQNQDCILI